MMLNTDGLVRKMTSRDVERVMEIELESFSLPWSRESYLGELTNQFAHYLVCDYEGIIIGFGGIWVVFEQAHITNVAVAKEYRTNGFGKKLMSGLEAIARDKKANRILLEVRPSNGAARKMYSDLGYIAISTRKQYYSDNGEDAIVMAKMLF